MMTNGSASRPTWRTDTNPSSPLTPIADWTSGGGYEEKEGLVGEKGPFFEMEMAGGHASGREVSFHL